MPMRVRFPLSLAGGLLAVLAPSVWSAAQPQAPSTIVAGNARFEFLTASLVRMELSPSGKFVDAPTAVIQKRDWPSVKVEQREQSGWLIAASTDLTLRY